jgi:uncharacterized membrane protein
MKPVQRYLVAGLLVWVPVGITFIILKLFVDLMDQTLVLIPAPWRPENLLGFRIPGLGILLTGVVVFVTGMLAANLVGRRLLKFWDSLLQRIPLVRSIYGGAKNFTEVVVRGGGQSFRKVVLINWGNDLWVLGFQTATELGEIHDKTRPDLVCVFVPTTPNPTTGLLMMIPKARVITLEMEVETAVKLLVSLGVVTPPGRQAQDAAATLAPAPPAP